MRVAADQHRATAVVAAGVDAGAFRQDHFGAQNPRAAAPGFSGRGVGRRGPQAAHVDRASEGAAAIGRRQAHCTAQSASGFELNASFDNDIALLRRDVDRAAIAGDRVRRRRGVRGDGAGTDHRALLHRHQAGLAPDLDLPAVLAVRYRLAALAYRQVALGLEDDLAAFIAQGRRTDVAVVPERPGKYPYRPAADLAKYLRGIGRRLYFELHVVEVAAANLDLFPSGQHDIAAFGLDHAFLGDRDIRGNDVDVAGAAIHIAVDLDRTGLAFLVEPQQPVLEVGVADVERGGDQPLDVYPCPGTKNNAIGVDQEYPAVRGQGAENAAGVLPDDTVENRAIDALLLKPGRFALADRKTLPVDNCAGTVGDRQRLALGGKTGVAIHYDRRHRVGGGRGGERKRTDPETGGNCTRKRPDMGQNRHKRRHLGQGISTL